MSAVRVVARVHDPNSFILEESLQRFDVFLEEGVGWDLRGLGDFGFLVDVVDVERGFLHARKEMG